MHRFSALALLLVLASGASAQSIFATSEDGRAFLLMEDGTWTEIEEPPAPPPPPPPPVAQTGLPPAPAPPRTLVGGDGTYSFRYDASRWRESPGLIPSGSDYSFELPYGAGYAAMIYEVSEIPLQTMRDIVLANAREGMNGQPTILSEKKASVDGATGLRLEFRVEVDGISVTMINTMYSGEWGTLQVITWTASGVMDRYRDELLRFQNAVTILPASGG